MGIHYIVFSTILFACDTFKYCTILGTKICRFLRNGKTNSSRVMYENTITVVNRIIIINYYNYFLNYLELPNTSKLICLVGLFR